MIFKAKEGGRELLQVTQGYLEGNSTTPTQRLPTVQALGC